MNWIRESNYAEEMKSVVEPYLKARMETGFDERVKGQPIYYEYFRSDHPKGVIVISHGFTESVKKFHEAVYYMLQAGYHVWGIDHRGHGESVRLNDNPYVVHAEHFRDYVMDLKHLTETRVIPRAGSFPVYLYGHSMGGCIGAWIIEEWPFMFRKAVLSSPMLGLSFGRIPAPVMGLAASVIGIGARKKESLNPVTRFDEADFENSCDSSRCRYSYYYEKRSENRLLQTTAPSIGWGREAIGACYHVTSKRQMTRISIPVLLFQAGNDTVVKNSSQDYFASHVKNCSIVRIPGMKHELYMTDSSVLIPYWEKIFSFLDRNNQTDL